MDIEGTKLYYKQISNHDLCDCAYCQNYISEIKSTYPKVAEYLSCLGVDIEKPFETMPLEPDAEGYIEYICSQYIVCGESNDFVKTDIDSVTIDVTDVHPSMQMEQESFIIKIYPIRLNWTI